MRRRNRRKNADRNRSKLYVRKTKGQRQHKKQKTCNLVHDRMRHDELFEFYCAAGYAYHFQSKNCTGKNQNQPFANDERKYFYGACRKKANVGNAVKLFAESALRVCSPCHRSVNHVRRSAINIEYIKPR